MSFPYEIQDVSQELNQQLVKDFSGERSGFVQVGPEKWFFPQKYKEQAAKLYNFKLRPDDVWIVTYPRSGTTWTQELLWLVGNNMDYEGAKVPLIHRFPFIEFSMLIHDEVFAELQEVNSRNPEQMEAVKMANTPAYELLDEAPPPRYIKTHLPFCLLPPKLVNTCKVVYVARNPKDVAVSYYHLSRLMKIVNFQGSFEKYWYYFEKDLAIWSPYWQHIIEGWEKRHHPNVLFLFYEDMKKDLPSAIKQVVKLLNKSCTEEEVKKLAEHLDIKNFKRNPAARIGEHLNGLEKEGEQPFVRKGQVGSWKEEFSPELLERANKWIEDNLKHTDLRFPL